MRYLSRWAGRTFLVTVAMVAVVGCGLSAGPTPEPAAGHTWNQTHRVDPPTGWTVTARNVGLDEESTSLSGPDFAGCLVQAWASKPQRYARPRWPDRVRVQGQPASYGNLNSQFGPYPRAVIWRNAKDRWFGVSCDLNRDGILQMAERVHADVTPVLVPFRLSAMPDRASLVQLIESRNGADRTVSAQFEMAGPAGPTRQLTMSISNASDESALQGSVERTQINGREAAIRTASQTICLTTRSDPICISGPGDEPASGWSTPDARHTADQTALLLTPVDDPDDRSTWYDADEAFPS